jgi:small subunit ribosomal protein S20
MGPDLSMRLLHHAEKKFLKRKNRVLDSPHWKFFLSERQIHLYGCFITRFPPEMERTQGQEPPRQICTPTIKSFFGTFAISKWEGILANTRSAKKRIRQNEKRRLRNREILSRTRTHVKLARNAIESGDYTASQEAVKEAISELDRAASKGVIHKNNAARRKRRLINHLNKLQVNEDSE